MVVCFVFRKEGYMMSYLLHEKGGSGGAWRTSHVEISVKGAHRVAVIGQVNDAFNGSMAFTNIKMEYQQCTEGVTTFFIC